MDQLALEFKVYQDAVKQLSAFTVVHAEVVLDGTHVGTAFVCGQGGRRICVSYFPFEMPGPLAPLTVPLRRLARFARTTQADLLELMWECTCAVVPELGGPTAAETKDKREGKGSMSSLEVRR